MAVRGHLADAAFEILLTVHPLLAGVFWLHAGEGWTYGEVAAQVAAWLDLHKAPSEKTIQRWIQGYERHDGVYVWGAEDWLANILDLVIEADRHHLPSELDTVLAFARRRSLDHPALLGLALRALWAVMDGDALPRLLALLGRARNKDIDDGLGTEAIISDGSRFVRLLKQLLELFEQVEMPSAASIAGVLDKLQREVAA